MPRDLTIILSDCRILALLIALAQVSCSLRLSSVTWSTRPVPVMTLFFLSPRYDIMEMVYSKPREKHCACLLGPT